MLLESFVIILVVLSSRGAAYKPMEEISSALCPSGCSCLANSSSLVVLRWNNSTYVDSERLSEQLDTLLTSNLTYHGNLTQLGIINVPLMRFPSSVCRLATLAWLDLMYSQIARLPDDCFANLPALNVLSALSNRITVLRSGAFYGLRKLQVLDLRSNSILSIGLAVFVELSNLQKLFLSYNAISELNDHIFDGLNELKALDLSYNKISSIGLRLFDRLNELEKIYLKSNRITQLQAGLFSGLHKLKILDLSHNLISSTALEEVFKVSSLLNSLNYVDLSANKIQTLEPWPICMGINATVTIDLSNNNISAFLNRMNWKKNCSTMRRVHFNLLLDHNSDFVAEYILRGWNMSLSTTRCVTPQKIMENLHFPLIPLNCVYLDCDSSQFIIFNLRLGLYGDSLNKILHKSPLAEKPSGDLCDRSFDLSEDTLVPLEQFVCELTENDGCPSSCRCVHRPANDTLHVYCSNTNHTVLPIELPELPKSYTKYKLDFSNNRLLRRLEHRDYFVNTSILDLSNSDIQLAESADVWNDILKIPQLNLYGNKLTSLPQSIVSLNVTTVSLNIANNSWDCSCDNKWISGWLNAISNRLTQDVLCDRPPRLSGKNIIQISEKEFCVDPVVEAAVEAAAEASKRVSTITMSSVAGVVVVLLFVIAVFYRLRVKLYTRWKFHPFDRDECPVEDMDYDVFLCCSSLDDEPVGNTILDSIEANGYRVCYHERDFMPGLIADNIEKSVTRSKRTVCLLTNNFIQRFANVFLS